MKTPQQNKKILFHKYKETSKDPNLLRKALEGTIVNSNQTEIKNKTLTIISNSSDKIIKTSKFIYSPKSLTKIVKPNNEIFETYINSPLKNKQIIFNSDDSIHEIDYDEKESELNYDDNVDEFNDKKSIYKDFYTDSIGEASSSFIGKCNKLINNLPKPFVKQNGRFEKNNLDSIANEDIKTNNKNEFENNDRESNCHLLLHYAQKGDKDKFLDILEMNNPSDVNFADESGWTALHYAVNEGNIKIVSILIRTNANVNLRTCDKKSPLHISASYGYFDISKLLVENGATIGLLDSEKNNPLHICSKLGHFELLKFLLERYPQADSKNIYGKTPIDVAINFKIKELLEDFLITNSNKYHKVKIHKTNNKSANNLILNFKNSNSNKEESSIIDSSTKILQIELPKSHTKYQSNNDLKLSPNANQDSKNKVKTSNFSKKINININIKDNNFIIDNNKNNKCARISQLINTGNPNKNKESQMKIISIDKLSKTDLSSEENQSNSYSEQESRSPLSNSLDDEKISPQSFLCHALLGKGSFGEVYLVEKKNTKAFYAMKILSKDKIMGQNLVRYAMTERNVLSITNHPFIVKLSFAFQTSDKLFLILDYCAGGDLSEHLGREKRFSEERAKIYLCEIILALEDLHKRDIIFRDLKPDNVVLDKNGHALLTDFGLSKEGVLDNKGAKSFCGSIAYLAPEMLKKTGHGKSVDWYLLGVIFFEMLVGIPPYFTNNKEQIFRNIEKGNLQIPNYISDNAKTLLKALLNKDPLTRLGAGKMDALEVKNHIYFKDVNWNDVYEKKLNPPIPALKQINLGNCFKPKIFEEINSTHLDERIEHFDGWSFINVKDESK